MNHIPERVAALAAGYRVVELHDAHVIAGYYSESMAGSLVVENGRIGNGANVSYDASEAGLGAARAHIAANLTASHHPRSYEASYEVAPGDIELVPIEEDDLPAYAGQAWRARIQAG